MMNRPEPDWRMAGFYGTYPGKMAEMAFRNSDEYGSGGVRGILKHKDRDSQVSSTRSTGPQYGYYTSGEPDVQLTLPRKLLRPERKCNIFFERVLQPCLAEFVAVCCCVFIFKHVETQLIDRQIPFLTRIILLSGVDAGLLGIYLTSLETIQLNPAVTLAQLFSMNTPWFLCIFLMIMQVLGGLAGVALYYFTHSGMFPALPKVVLDMDGDYNGGVTELLVGTSAVVLSYLMATRPVGGNHIYVVRLYQSAVGIVCSVALDSFLALLHSNISWNPITAFSLTLFHSLKGSGPVIWHNHYVYWLGPALGSLGACFLYRLCLAPADRRIGICGNSPQHSDVC